MNTEKIENLLNSNSSLTCRNWEFKKFVKKINDQILIFTENSDLVEVAPQDLFENPDIEWIIYVSEIEKLLEIKIGNIRQSYS